MSIHNINMDLKIGVVGAGSWGTALADLLADKGFHVDIWTFEEEVRRQILENRENEIYLPGFKLSERLTPSRDLNTVIDGKAMILIVVPSHVMREVTIRMSGRIPPDSVVVSASKGIENVTLKTISGIVSETLPEIESSRFAVLSGPSFAREVASRSATAVTAASKDLETAVFVQQMFSSPAFRVYTSEDVIGVELGGSVKNVIAIASGMIDGLGLGYNTRAALITRGLAEIRRLGVKLGADSKTFSGLAGVGDLVLTCTGTLSRNYTVGKKIGEGKKPHEIIAEMRMVAEGVKTAQSLFTLSNQLGIEMPISHEIYHILYNDASPGDALKRLMTRDLKHEFNAY